MRADLSEPGLPTHAVVSPFAIIPFRIQLFRRVWGPNSDINS